MVSAMWLVGVYDGLHRSGRALARRSFFAASTRLGLMRVSTMTLPSGVWMRNLVGQVVPTAAQTCSEIPLDDGAGR
jgi:hypothetical protein